MNLAAGLRTASFRGVAFLLPDDDVQGARRWVPHEYPGKDQAYLEDLGLGVGNFSLEAVIAGSDFNTAADNFEKALRAAGPGTLIHPHLGEVEVAVARWRRAHSVNAIGEVRFQFEAFLYGKAIYPLAGIDTVLGLLKAGDFSFNAIGKDFLNNFTVPGLDFLSIDGLQRVTDFVDGIKATLSRNGIFNLLEGDYFGALDILSGGFVGDVISTFQGIGDFFRPIAARIIGTNEPSAGNGRQALGLVKSMISASAISVADGSALGTASQAIRVQNAQAIDLLFRQASLTTAVKAARFAEYESRDEAVTLRSQITAALSTMEELLAAAGWEESYVAAGAMASAISRDINEKIGRLPRTAIFNPGVQLPADVIAHRLYGDDPASLFGKADDLITRNHIRHPGFLPTSGIEFLLK